jgi:hypothetical protein
MRRAPYLGTFLWTAAVIFQTAAAAETASEPAERQALDDAWWTGPLLAAGATPLPRGRWLIEPYLFDVKTSARYDADGTRRDTATSDFIGSQSYVLYGVTDRFTAGLIPRFGFTDVDGAPDSSGIRVGDLTVQLQYGLTRFREGSRVPTTSLVLQQTLPTGKHDRLGDRLSDGNGAGAHTTSLALHSQSYFWMPNGRILRARLNLGYAFSNEPSVEDESVYGTPRGFRGHAAPGDAVSINAAAEYSVTRNWVLAFDAYYQHDEPTRVRGNGLDASSGSSWHLALAPAVEYNLSATVGVIVGARWIAAGRNASASITPAIALNMVF